MNKKILGGALAGAMLLALVGCASGGDDSAGGAKDPSDLVVGFSQVGAESGWRTANTKDIQDAFKDAGIDLKFSDAQQKQENQIKAIRSYIQQKVDVIAFSPVVESGWDAVLKEAKDASIPVVLTDRAVDSKDDLAVRDLPRFRLRLKRARRPANGSSNEYKARRADQDRRSSRAPPVPLRRSTAPRASPTRSRTTPSSRSSHPDRRLHPRRRQAGHGGLLSPTRTSTWSSRTTTTWVSARSRPIEAAGLKPGVDIKIITVDAVKDGMQALADGKINFIVECSPLLGAQLVDMVKKIIDGETARSGSSPRRPPSPGPGQGGTARPAVLIHLGWITAPTAAPCGRLPRTAATPDAASTKRAAPWPLGRARSDRRTPGATTRRRA